MSNWLMKLIIMVVTAASPEIRKGLCEFTKEMERKAKETSNPWDDVLAGLLKVVLFCD